MLEYVKTDLVDFRLNYADLLTQRPIALVEAAYGFEGGGQVEHSVVELEVGVGRDLLNTIDYS